MGGGFQQCIRIFDLQRPGRQIEDWILSTRKGNGQKGIIGALACASNGSDLVAAGSYNKSVCIYHSGTKGKPLARFADAQRTFEMGGVTHLDWYSDHYVISGHRRDRYLRVWDLRKAGGEEEAKNQEP